MSVHPPKRLRFQPDQLAALEDIAAVQVPPVNLASYGAFPELLGRLVLWARDVICHRIRLCPQDLTPLREDLSCPTCGGHWVRPPSQ